MSPLEWTCQRCTYLHQYPSQRCSMCNALRVSKQQMRDFVSGNNSNINNNKRRVDIDIGNGDGNDDVNNDTVDGFEAVNMVTMNDNGPSAQSSSGVVDVTAGKEEASDVNVGELISSSAAAVAVVPNEQQQQQPSTTRRLGLLACPNSASLGWGGDSALTATIDLTTATPEKKKSSKAAATSSHSSSPMKMNVDTNNNNTTTKEEPIINMESTNNEEAATIINASSSSSPSPSSDGRKKRPRLSPTLNDPTIHTNTPPTAMIDQKQQPHQQLLHSNINNEEELSEFQEPMKGGGGGNDTTASNNGYHSSNYENSIVNNNNTNMMVNDETAQPSSASSSAKSSSMQLLLPKNHDSTKEEEVLPPLSVTLDYEPISTISTSDNDDESMIHTTTKEGTRSQILTITYNNNNSNNNHHHPHGGANDASSSSSRKESLVTSSSSLSFVVGTISGKAKLDVLPPLLLAADDSSSSCRDNTNQEAQEEQEGNANANANADSDSNKSCHRLQQPEISLDVFGYRMQQQQQQQSKQQQNQDQNQTRPPHHHYNNNDSIIVNRPDWMLALPLSVVVVTSNATTNCDRDHDSTNNNDTKPNNTVVLRVRIQSIPNEERDDNHQKEEATKSSAYSAYPEESYQLNLLPPNNSTYLHSNNYTAGGSGVCTILESWKETLDEITTEDDNGNGDNGNGNGMVMSSSSGGNNRILLCGAKGVGKSTLLRYAANRMLSSTVTAGTTAAAAAAAAVGPTNPTSPSHHRRHRRIAILDLDCGQSELSPPGMLTLTIISRPLISDPPVHMVCGGSCDHYGTLAMQEEDSVKHVSSYYFGDITSKADPDTYIQMTSMLMGRYNELLEKEKEEDGGEEEGKNDNDYDNHLPLLVNTDGWVKGLGFEILSAIIGVVNPGHIMQIMGTTKAKSFDMSSHATTAAAATAHEHSSHPPTQQQPRRLVHVIQSFDESLLLTSLDDDTRSMSSYRSVNSTGSATSSGGALSASSADHRIHRLCTYFVGGYNQMMNLRPKKIFSGVSSSNEGICFHKQSGLHDPNNVIGMTLASMCPYAVPFQSVQLYPSPGLLDEMISAGVDGRPPCWGIRGNLAHGNVLDSLNGSIVGLCCSPSDELDMPLSTTTTTTTHCNNAGSGVPILNCVGLGIIRSIDHTRKIFFVLTPVHPSLLGNVTAFVGGSISLPLQCVYRGVHSDAFPFLSCGHSLTSSTLGADVMKSKNFSRKK